MMEMRCFPKRAVKGGEGFKDDFDVLDQPHPHPVPKLLLLFLFNLIK